MVEEGLQALALEGVAAEAVDHALDAFAALLAIAVGLAAALDPLEVFDFLDHTMENVGGVVVGDVDGDGVARGEGIGASMRRVGGFPAMAVRMIAVGEESGSLDKQLDRLATEYRKRLDVVVKSLGEIIKPALILLAGALFIFLIVALLLPIYDLVRQSVNHSLGGG